MLLSYRGELYDEKNGFDDSSQVLVALVEPLEYSVKKSKVEIIYCVSSMLCKLHFDEHMFVLIIPRRVVYGGA